MAWNPGVFTDGAEAPLDLGWSFWRPEADDTHQRETPEPPADAPWHPCAVPAAWETYDIPKAFAGPVWFRCLAAVPATWAGSRLLVHFEAVSYACRVFWDGHEVGAHIGAWDAFDVDVPARAASPGPHTLTVCVHKPGGRYPLRGTLAGFLPYVGGTMFGGLWQGVSLRRARHVVVEDVDTAPLPALGGARSR